MTAMLLVLGAIVRHIGITGNFTITRFWLIVRGGKVLQSWRGSGGIIGISP